MESASAAFHPRLKGGRSQNSASAGERAPLGKFLRERFAEIVARSRNGSRAFS